MKTKHWTILVVTLVLMAGLLLSACAEPTPTTPSPTTPTPTTPTPTTPTPTTSPTTQPPPTTITPTTPAPTTPAPAGPKYGGTFTAAEPIFPGQPLGWPAGWGGAVALFQQPCLDPLIVQDLYGNLGPHLATDWEVAPDGSSVTFHLRKGVKFHDGSDLNANAVKWTFDMLIPAKRSSTIDWKSVDVLDNYTVRVNLLKWTNYSLGNFAYSGGNYIISPTAYQEHGEEWMSEHMVGTGPFKQTGYVRDIQVEYERFDDYWQEGKPYLDKIVYMCVKDPMTQVAALKAQELDGMAIGADKKLFELQQEGMQAVVVNTGVIGYFPDTVHPESPVANLKVREAMEYAIDKEALVDAISYGFFGACYQYAIEGTTAFDPTIPGRHYDLDKAKQLMAEAGYPDGFKMNLLVSSDDPGPAAAVILQGFWAELGIDAEIELLDSPKFTEYQRTGWNNGLLYASPAGTANWIRTLASLFDPEGINYVSVERTPEFIDLFNAAAMSFEKDPEKEKAVVRYIYDHQMTIPVFEKSRAWVLWPYVKGGDFLLDASTFFWDAQDIWLDK